MLRLYIYIAAFILGACLLCASMFLGHHDADAGADLNVDSDADGDAHAEADAHADADHADHGVTLSDFWLPFVSVRFWVFFLCFFGLTGSVFSLVGLAGKWQTLLLA